MNRVLVILFLAFSFFTPPSFPQESIISPSIEEDDPFLDITQYDLGMAYYLGDGVVKDRAEAMKWFELSAEKGNVLAQLELGKGYYLGDGVPQDYIEAIKWLKLASEQELPSYYLIDDHGLPQYLIGRIYYVGGKGVSLDHEEAVKWFELASKKGSSNAQFQLGMAYSLGEGIAQDHRKAIRWFKLSARNNNAHAQYELGRAYLLGEGVLQDYPEALKWFKLSAEQNHNIAQFELGKAYFLGEIYFQGYPVIKQDYQKAKKLFKKSCNNGLQEGCKAYKYINQIEDDRL